MSSRAVSNVTGLRGFAAVAAFALISTVALVSCATLARAQDAPATSEGATAQSAQPGAIPARELVVGTREAPPFAIKGEDGKWTGMAIELWRSVAAQTGLKFRFKEAGLQELIDGVAGGNLDAAVAALTVTPEREKRLDFTHPFYTTGFGIAVTKQEASWLSTLYNLISWRFLQAIAALAILLAVVGLAFWLVERKHNPDEFGGKPLSGLGSGFWFSAVTMTTVGYGDKAPVTVAGRIIALIWMFGAIIIISTFTGMIASALTVDRLGGSVTGPGDLPNVKVGSISGSASDGWLANRHVGFSSYDSVDAGLKAVAGGKIDAFVYDAPLLKYSVKNGLADKVAVLPGTYGRQDYAIALPPGSPLREAINRRLLEYVTSDAWSDARYRYLGGDH